MNQHQTDVNVFINDLDGGVFVNKLGAVLSEVAFGVNSTNKKGKVCVEFELSSLDENRVSVSHKLKFTRPTMRGSKSEEDTTNTVQLQEAKARLEKKIALYIDDGCDAAVLNAAFAPALNCHTRESFFSCIAAQIHKGGNQ